MKPCKQHNLEYSLQLYWVCTKCGLVTDDRVKFLPRDELEARYDKIMQGESFDPYAKGGSLAGEKPS